MHRFTLSPSLCAAAFALAACGGGTFSPALTSGNGAIDPAYGTTPISHIVIIIQENRTFNDFFATFPGVTGATIGKKRVGKKTEPIALKEVNLKGDKNLNHGYKGFLVAYDDGKMDGFNNVQYPSSGKSENATPYEYVNPAQIAPYWTMAQEYGLANAMFATQGSASFTAHQDLIRGGTEIDPTDSLIDNPPYSGVWGCDSAPGTTTTLITTSLQYEAGDGPFPCTTSFPPYTYDTLRDLLDAHSVSWKYYTPKVGNSGAIWDAFDVIAPVRYGPEWGTNVNWPETNIFGDISSGNLAAVSWVIPDGANSDHPGKGPDTGPSWVASVVNAIGESYYWNSTAIIIVWDDWGGFYDPVTPPGPRDNQGGPGLRVPMIVVSPYSRETSSYQPGYISNTFYQFGSIVRFVEDTFNLGRLGTTDGTSNSIADMFDFYQAPRSFEPIGSKYSREYFLHQKPSGLPVDDQ